jgi:hypothetical protein
LLLEQQLQHHQHAAHATAGLPHAAATAAEASMGPPGYVPASYLASWQQQQQQQQQQEHPYQAGTLLEQHCLQPAATEVQCVSEQMEDVFMSSSLSHGTASASAGSQQPLPLTSQASLQQARSSQLLTQSLLRSSSSGPGSKSDTGRRTGAGSKPGGKALQAQAKLQLLYNAKLAEYDQLKVRAAEQQASKQTAPTLQTCRDASVLAVCKRVAVVRLDADTSPQPGVRLTRARRHQHPPLPALLL